MALSFLAFVTLVIWNVSSHCDFVLGNEAFVTSFSPSLSYTVMSIPSQVRRALMTYPCSWAICTLVLDTLYSNFNGNNLVRCVFGRFFLVLDPDEGLARVWSCRFAVDAVLSAWWPSESCIIVGAVQ
jgi:hypothetical protein